MKIEASIPCFFVEGIPGVGKSTFVQILGRHFPGIVSATEPIESFDNTHDGDNPLELLLTDQKRWAFTVNMYITLMRYRTIKKLAAQIEKVKPPFSIADRSIHSDLFVYVKMAYDEGNLTPLELKMYKEFFAYMTEDAPVKPTGFIYLQATPEICLERLRQRNRASESTLPLAYEQLVEQCYKQWLIEKKDIPAALASIPVLVIDATKNLRDDLVEQQKCVEQVREFIDRVTNNIHLAPAKGYSNGVQSH